MGDVSAEPSMEEILSSIKRIIAEEGDAPARARRAPSRAAPRPDPVDDIDEVLELSEPAPEPSAEPVAAEPSIESIVSDRVAEAARARIIEALGFVESPRERALEVPADDLDPIASDARG